MLKWAKNHIRKQSYSNKVEAKIDFRACMERLSRDLKLYKISPNDLIKEQIVTLRLSILTFFAHFPQQENIFSRDSDLTSSNICPYVCASISLWP